MPELAWILGSKVFFKFWYDFLTFRYCFSDNLLCSLHTWLELQQIDSLYKEGKLLSLHE